MLIDVTTRDGGNGRLPMSVPYWIQTKSWAQHAPMRYVTALNERGGEPVVRSGKDKTR